jgi:hypothetical protein
VTDDERQNMLRGIAEPLGGTVIAGDYGWLDDEYEAWCLSD